MTPVFGHGHLRLYLLSLLSERPMHGYELMQALSDRFGGTYIPSAGTIYPRLSKLGEEGLVSREADGRKTVYSITDAGIAELAARQAELDEIERGVTTTVRSLADEVRASVADAMRTLRADLAAVAGESTPKRGASESRERADAAAHPAPTETAAPPASPADPAPSTEEPDARAASRRELAQVEQVLADFRNDVRVELRSRASRDVLPAGTAAQLEAALAEVRVQLLG
ncbi:MAG: PadR family transcriptional regulator [Salinibacterium sp.]|nr:PadR family transcriptional regulator [Salinibacterium sp.]MBF0672583.1 PadR family transcriptional regulator [Salinibacterium sp.]